MSKPFKKYTLSVSTVEVRFKGAEREWAEGAITEKNRTLEMIQGLNWLNYMCDGKDNRRFLEDWIYLRREETREQDLEILSKSPDKYLVSNFAHLARLYAQGFPLTDEEHSRIWEQVLHAYNRALTDAQIAKVEKSPEKSIGVQERMDLQVDDIMEQIDTVIYDLLKGTAKSANAANATSAAKLSSIHYKKLSTALLQRSSELVELQTARANKSSLDDLTAQLIEGYAWVSNRALKATVEFLEQCHQNSLRLASEKQVDKVRKKRPVDRAKLVRKLKHLKENTELKIKSISAVECLGTNEVWVYNTKTRKLGVYRTEYPNGIMVKGSSFIGIIESKCVQKTLRKPEIQLAEFTKLGKNQLRKWFEAIKGVELKMKARTNEHTVLLRVT